MNKILDVYDSAIINSETSHQETGMRTGQMKLGLSIRSMGYHVAAWRHPAGRPDAAMDFRSYADLVLAAERAKFDMVFLADTLSLKAVDEPPGAAARSSWNAEFEPITLLSALAPLTNNIGLVATASTSYNEPFHIARKFSSLDHISGGRAAWNMVTSWSDKDALNFSREKTRGYAERYARGREFVEVVRGLWDTWEDDAIIADREAGVFYDYSKVRVLDHKGEHFAVQGPLTSPRTPQGRPIIVQAGASVEGREIAVDLADIIYASADSLADAQKYYADIQHRLKQAGRPPGDLLMMFGVTIFVAASEAEARAEYERLQDLIDPMVALSAIARKVPSLAKLSLDDEVTESNFDTALLKSGGERLRQIVRDQKPTVRQLLKIVGHGTTQNVLIGTASQVADKLEEWYRNYACDGFNITPSHAPTCVRNLGEFLVPELQRRGLFRTEYEGTTLRENLGLSWPKRSLT